MYIGITVGTYPNLNIDSKMVIWWHWIPTLALVKVELLHPDHDVVEAETAAKMRSHFYSPGILLLVLLLPLGPPPLRLILFTSQR